MSAVTIEKADEKVYKSSKDRTCLKCRQQIRRGDEVRYEIIGGNNVPVHNKCEAAPAGGEFDLDAICRQVAEKLGTGSGSGGGESIEAVAEKVKAAISDDLAERLGEGFQKAMQAVVKGVATTVNQKLTKSSKELSDFVDKKITEARLPHVIELRQEGREGRKLEGQTYHPAFERVLKLAAKRKNIFLPGPAGCGKSHLASQVADALGLKFGMVSLSQGISESKLVGRSNPNLQTGEEVFKTTDFVDCYENGGVFLFDEIDAADANVLLIINSALANGKLALDRCGKRIAVKHPDFICIAAANTYGRGSDRQYVGRTELDESTLDRFRIGIVPLDYDPTLESILCPDETLRKTLTLWRKRIFENRLERIVSTRFMKDAFEMMWDVFTGEEKKPGQFTMEEVEEAFFGGWPEDEVERVLGRKLGAKK